MDENLKKGVLKAGEDFLGMLTGTQGGSEVSEQDDTNKKKSTKGDEDVCNANKNKSIKVWTWAIAFALIVLQVVFLKWWTILTGTATALAAYYVADILVRMDEVSDKVYEFLNKIKEEHKTDCVCWIIAATLIIVQIFILEWWVLLTGPLTVLITILLLKLLGVISRYFNEN